MKSRTRGREIVVVSAPIAALIERRADGHAQSHAYPETQRRAIEHQQSEQKTKSRAQSDADRETRMGR